jgi:hypothetical protein
MAIIETPAVAGRPRLLLRLEGAALLIVAVVLYAWIDASWWLFAILFLIPDVSFAAYLVGPRFGAFAYNAVHTTLGPAALALAALSFGMPTALAIALIWAAHLGLDRALGFGLKYSAGFSYTHLGRLGSASEPSS